MDLSEWISIKDVIYLCTGVIIGIITSVIMYEKTEKLYLNLLLLFGKARRGTFIKISIYNPLYDERDPMKFDNRGLQNGIFTYELKMPFRYINEDEMKLIGKSLEQLDQEIIESVNIKFKTNYSTRFTKIESMTYKQNQIFRKNELDRKHPKDISDGLNCINKK